MIFKQSKDVPVEGVMQEPVLLGPGADAIYLRIHFASVTGIEPNPQLPTKFS
jgi:hypothetical protein